MAELVAIFVFGMFTHYHFIIMLLKKVKISRILTYVGINILGLLIYSIIYPSFYIHMFGTHRGAESAGNLLNVSDYIDRIRNTFKVFDTNVFVDIRTSYNTNNYSFYNTCNN